MFTLLRLVPSAFFFIESNFGSTRRPMGDGLTSSTIFFGFLDFPVFLSSTPASSSLSFCSTACQCSNIQNIMTDFLKIQIYTSINNDFILN